MPSLSRARPRPRWAVPVPPERRWRCANRLLLMRFTGRSARGPGRLAIEPRDTPTRRRTTRQAPLNEACPAHTGPMRISQRDAPTSRSDPARTRGWEDTFRRHTRRVSAGSIVPGAADARHSLATDASATRSSVGADARVRTVKTYLPAVSHVDDDARARTGTVEGEYPERQQGSNA
jgi:hypothetical protein